MPSIRSRIVEVVPRLEQAGNGGDEETETTTTEEVALSYLKPSMTVRELSFLAHAVKRSHHVKRLTLSKSLRDSHPEAVLVFIQTVLPNHPSLQIVDLDGNHLSDIHATAIGNALKTNTVLQMLNLSSNNIGPTGAQAIAEGLQANATSSLEHLSLSSNGIGPKGCKAIAQALKKNPKSNLKGLYLAANDIQDDGVLALMDTLSDSSQSSSSSSSPSLMELHIHSNAISDKGFHAIANALRYNTSLCELGVSINSSITPLAIDDIKSTLQHSNYTLETLYLHGNRQTHNAISSSNGGIVGIPKEQLDRIMKLCDTNTHIKVAQKCLTNDLEKKNLFINLYPMALECISTKPNLMYSILRSRDDWFLQQGNTSPPSTPLPSRILRVNATTTQATSSFASPYHVYSIPTKTTKVLRRCTPQNERSDDIPKNDSNSFTFMESKCTSSTLFHAWGNVWIQFESSFLLTTGHSILKEIFVILVLILCITLRVALKSEVSIS